MICSNCSTDKDESLFYKSHKTICKECICKRNKLTRDKNKSVISKRKDLKFKLNLFKENKIKCTKCKIIKDKQQYSLEPKGFKGYRGDCNSCKNSRITEYNKQTGKRNEYMTSYLQDTNNRLADNLRSRLRKAIKNKQKIGSAVDNLGCTIEELKQHLEEQFQEGMNWDNWSRVGWHIDHIKPLASFDLTKEEQLKEACNYKNLQPLWAKDNLSKGSK